MLHYGVSRNKKLCLCAVNAAAFAKLVRHAVYLRIYGPAQDVKAVFVFNGVLRP